MVPPASAHDPRPELSWPTPRGWRDERIPFPIEFAPTLPYRGVEDVRFAPGFFRAEAPGFWTYVFAWACERPAAPSLAGLGHDLEAYWHGLAAAVAGDDVAAASPAAVALEPAPAARPRNGHRVAALHGEARILDPFVTRRSLGLCVRVDLWTCVPTRHVIAVVRATPGDATGPSGRAAWRRLGRATAALRCHA